MSLWGLPWRHRCGIDAALAAIDVTAPARTNRLSHARARFGSVDEIYKSETGRDILTEPTLLFTSTDTGGA
jgi:hypothetical protein